MCYHIVAVCSLCEARTGWYTFIKPCNDRALSLGWANLAPVDTLLRFYNSHELGPCPNDQTVLLRSSFAPAPPCGNLNCGSAQVYEWISDIPRFLSEATQQLFGHQDPSFSNPWTQEDREMLLNAALAVDMHLARASFVAQTCGGDDRGLLGVHLGPTGLNPGLALVAEEAAVVDHGLAGLVPNADISGGVGNLPLSPAAGQAAVDNQLPAAGQAGSSTAPKGKRSNPHWNDEADEMLLFLHGQRDAEGKRIWSYSKMIKDIPCFHGRSRNALESRRLKLARRIKKQTGVVNAGCNPGNNNTGPNPDSDSGPDPGTGPGATTGLTLIAA